MTKLVLIVEDDLAQAKLLQIGLKKHGVNSAISSNGKDAKDYVLNQNHGSPVGFIVDLKMPLMNGFMFIEWLRNEAPLPARKAPLLVYTTSEESSDINEAYEDGASGYLVKKKEWEHQAALMGDFFNEILTWRNT